MANISSSEGTIEFVNFTEEEVQYWVNKHISADYGFNEIDVEKGKFEGSGRWSFYETLLSTDWGLHNNQEILLNFYDEEPSLGFDYYQAGVINKDGYSSVK